MHATKTIHVDIGNIEPGRNQGELFPIFAAALLVFSFSASMPFSDDNGIHDLINRKIAVISNNNMR